MGENSNFLKHVGSVKIRIIESSGSKPPRSTKPQKNIRDHNYISEAVLRARNVFLNFKLCLLKWITNE